LVLGESERLSSRPLAIDRWMADRSPGARPHKVPVPAKGSPRRDHKPAKPAKAVPKLSPVPVEVEVAAPPAPPIEVAQPAPPVEVAQPAPPIEVEVAAPVEVPEVPAVAVPVEVPEVAVAEVPEAPHAEVEAVAEVAVPEIAEVAPKQARKPKKAETPVADVATFIAGYVEPVVSILPTKAPATVEPADGSEFLTLAIAGTSRRHADGRPRPVMSAADASDPDALARFAREEILGRNAPRPRRAHPHDREPVANEGPWLAPLRKAWEPPEDGTPAVQPRRFGRRRNDA
jgi:nicotinate-nucleotide--dimethylbenzimidazole phosphoribosyltransferase